MMPTAADAEAALPVLRQMRVAVLSPHVDPEGKPLVLFTAPVMVSAHQPHPATPAHPQVSSAARVQADTIQVPSLPPPRLTFRYAVHPSLSLTHVFVCRCRRWSWRRS